MKTLRQFLNEGLSSWFKKTKELEIKPIEPTSMGMFAVYYYGKYVAVIRNSRLYPRWSDKPLQEPHYLALLPHDWQTSGAKEARETIINTLESYF